MKDKIVKEHPAISIVVPVFNEEENVLPLYHIIRSTFDALGRMYEIMFVDDGSRVQIRCLDTKPDLIKEAIACLTLPASFFLEDDTHLNDRAPRGSDCLYR